MQPPGGVGDQHVGAARLGRLHRVEHHGRRVRARRLRDDRHVVALAPDCELLDRRSAEGVAGREHDLVPSRLQPPRELADRRGLAGAVHADHQDHERRFVRSIESGRPTGRRMASIESVSAAERVDVAELAARDLAVQVRRG